MKQTLHASSALRLPACVLQPARKLRVMIVEDSQTVREFLTHIIARDARLQVVAAVDSGEAALRELHHHAPDVISMDIHLPGMNGIEATRRIMSERPTPIVVVAGGIQAEDLKISMNALRAGALWVLEKPVGVTHRDYEALAERLCTQLTIMSQVKVLRQRRPIIPVTDKSRGFDRDNTCSLGVPGPKMRRLVSAPKALGIVASTGGPNALLEVLNNLPTQFPIPILLVQHMTSSFMAGFIDWLDSNCSLRVVEAQAGALMQPGSVYVAPAERHLMLRHGRMSLDSGVPVSMQRPSGTVLFQSMAKELGSSAAGVLLTGMGDDGAEGLAAIRQAGGYTITEDETTAVVYGMPAAAVALGASCESLPLQAISPRLCELVVYEGVAT